MENLLLPDINFAVIAPSLALCVAGMVLLLIGVFSKPGRTSHIAWLSVIGLAVAGYLTVQPWGAAPDSGFVYQVVQDNITLFFNAIFLVAALLTILMSDDYLKREGYAVGEYYAMILFTTAGAMWMASATDMMTMFLGLEVLSVSLYVLAGFFRRDTRSNEAGLKYFLLGAFSTGFLLYGMALLYGVVGSTNLAAVGNMLGMHGAALISKPMVVAGMMLLLTGFMFKIAIVPFHMWTPDVYEGAPTPITAFMSAGPKAAAIAALLRVLDLSFMPMQDKWTLLLAVLAVLTMTVGNLLAILQTNIKRLLAYSSVAHAGYALVGIVAYNNIGLSGVLYYMLVYAFMNIGAFAVLALAGKQGEDNLTLDGIAGFGYKKPFLGVAMTIFLLSLMGMPPTAGFAAKFYVFAGAVEAGWIPLAIIGVLNSALSLYYYLKIMVAMYFREPTEDFSWVSLPVGAMICILLAIAGVLYLGVIPQEVMELAKAAI